MQCFGVEERIYRQKTIKKMTETDIELIEGLRKQSPKAQQQMLDRYGRDVFAQVARLVPGIENAEEVYQDVFVKVFKNIDRYDEGKSALKTWISAIVWEHNDEIDGTIYMISSLRPDIYAKNLETSKNTFKIEGRVDANIKDSLYNIYIANTGEELANIGDDDYVACVPVVNKRFEYQTELDHPVAGRLRCIFPNGELCSAWINLDFVPGETYRITVHDGYYDEDRDYERRVGRYSGKSLLTARQKRGNDDVAVADEFVVADTIPIVSSTPEAAPQWRELLKVKLESKVMTIEAGMETIKATYKYLKPAYETRNFSVMNKTIAHIAKQNETLDANFQDLIKTLKQSPEIPQKERLEVISGGYKEILKFYTEQNQGFTEITKELGYLPKEMQKAQKVINKLIEKNMNEMSKMITEIR